MTSPIKQNPLAVIFLDMEGVLTDLASPRNSKTLAQHINNIVKSYPFYSNPELSKLAELRAKARCLNRDALKNLYLLIDTLSGSVQVAIVITSLWREEEVSAFNLKEHVLKDHTFHHYIIDKIPDRDVTHIRQRHDHPGKPLQKTPSEDCIEKYVFALTHQKRRIIEDWLRENHKSKNIYSFVIIDGSPSSLQSELKIRFPGRLVQVDSKKLFSFDDAKRCFNILKNPAKIKQEQRLAKKIKTKDRALEWR